jgi:hypothetical protein
MEQAELEKANRTLEADNIRLQALCTERGKTLVAFGQQINELRSALLALQMIGAKYPGHPGWVEAYEILDKHLEGRFIPRDPHAWHREPKVVELPQ